MSPGDDLLLGCISIADAAVKHSYRELVLSSYPPSAPTTSYMCAVSDFHMCGSSTLLWGYMDHPEKVSQVQSWDKKELLMPPEGSDQGTR